MSDRVVFSLSAPFRIGLVWAQNLDGVIGVDGDLPWHLPEDLAHFKALTLGCVVIHGRKSYEALPSSVRPLPGRENVVVTRNAEYEAPGAVVVHSLEEAVRSAPGKPIWVVGGGLLYRKAVAFADVLVVTSVDVDTKGDTYAPDIDPAVWRQVQCLDWVRSIKGPRFKISEYRKRDAK